MITYASLRSLQPSGLASAAHEYGRSATLLGHDAARYRHHVVRPIRSGHVWRGGGQADAGVVTRVLALAFDTAAVRMRTVASLLTTLHTELAAAKREIARVVDDVESSGYRIDANGTITDPADSGGMFACPSTGGVDVGEAHSDQNIARWQAKLRIAVARARRADSTCSTGLADVIGAEFVVTTTAQPGMLKRAEDANLAAYGGYIRALTLPRVLAAAHRYDISADQHTEHGPDDFWRDYAKGLWDSTLGAVPDLVGLVWLLARAQWGDPTAWAALAAVPPALWKQISTVAGWKAMFAVGDLEAGRPGEFAGRNTLLGREILRTFAKKAAEDAARRAVEPAARSVVTKHAATWVLPRDGGGARIDGRWYTEHALERMAPDTPDVRAILLRRCIERARAAGLEPGTPEFGEWWRKHHPDPRGIPPNVVEAEIRQPGSTNVEVKTNKNGDVITVFLR